MMIARDDERLRGNRSDRAITTGSGDLEAFQSRMFADTVRCFPMSDLPNDFPFTQIDRRDPTPRWPHEGQFLHGQIGIAGIADLDSNVTLSAPAINTPGVHRIRRRGRP